MPTNPAWGDDNLTQFFDMADTNRRANREKYAGWYAKLSRIDACFVVMGKNLGNVTPIMLTVLALRCQYALKTAVGLALAGQATEAFVMLRSALEYAAYALAIFDKPALEDVFISRHMSDADAKAMKEQFRISEVKAVVRRFDAKLADIFDEMYQRTIDFGGHPNPHAAFGMMIMEERGGSTVITTWATTGDEKIIAHALKSAAQVGLNALYIFQHALKAKFELLGIRAEIEALRNEGGL